MFCFGFLLLFQLYFVLIIKGECPTGSIQSYTNSSICYIFNSNNKYFLEADQFCKTNFGGHLVAIHNMLDNVLISENALSVFTESSNADFWIGANDLVSKGRWSWLDNSSFNFFDWDKGQPQNASGINCGAVKMHGALWTVDDCFKQKPFVRQINHVSATTTVFPPTTTASKPKTCPDTWTYYNFTKSCYKVFFNQTWLEAETRCGIDQAHLASIHSREEDIFIATLASPYSNSTNGWWSQTYVGFFTEDNNAEWHWTDGTPFDYIQWSSGNPDNPGVENCGQIWSGPITETAVASGIKFGDYNNFSCDILLPTFVCKKSPK